MDNAHNDARTHDRIALLRLLCAVGTFAETNDRSLLDVAAFRARADLVVDRAPGEHPEDRCEGCRMPFEPWHASPEEWKRATGRSWGGPIVCRACFDRLGPAPEPAASDGTHKTVLIWWVAEPPEAAVQRLSDGHRYDPIRGTHFIRWRDRWCVVTEEAVGMFLRLDAWLQDADHEIEWERV